MAMTAYKKPLCLVLAASLILSLCGGCGTLKLHSVYCAALGGAVVGYVIGHQSNEDGEGAALGAVVFATGELLHQLDEQAETRKAEKEIAQGKYSSPLLASQEPIVAPEPE